MGQSTASVFRGGSVHKGKISLRSNPNSGMVQRRDDRREKVHEPEQSARDRNSSGTEEGQQVEGEAYCANCVNLLYMGGILRCAEFNKLLSAEDIKEPLECDKFLPLEELKNMRRFRGTANKMNVVDEIVLGTLVQQAVVHKRCVSLAELESALPMHKTSIHDVLGRLEEQGKVKKSKFEFIHPAARMRKHWIVNGYWPLILPDQLNRESNET